MTEKSGNGSEKQEWSPPSRIEDLFERVSGGTWSSTNTATAGPKEVRELPKGSASLRLYSLGTPNGNNLRN